MVFAPADDTAAAAAAAQLPGYAAQRYFSHAPLVLVSSCEHGVKLRADAKGNEETDLIYRCDLTMICQRELAPLF